MENLFPDELRGLIFGVNGDTRQNILSYLMKEKELSYSKINKKIQSTKGNLNYHLNTLVESGLITRQLRKGNDVSDYGTYYSISHLGKIFINHLFEVLKPTSLTPQIPKISGMNQTSRISFIERQSMEINEPPEIVAQPTPYLRVFYKSSFTPSQSKQFLNRIIDLRLKEEQEKSDLPSSFVDQYMLTKFQKKRVLNLSTTQKEVQ